RLSHFFLLRATALVQSPIARFKLITDLRDLFIGLRHGCLRRSQLFARLSTGFNLTQPCLRDLRFFVRQTRALVGNQGHLFLQIRRRRLDRL
ncbi:MAG TPA: hypothetical protein VHW03_08305, partial [Chthoniobacterales bacterium]|nr:hypothetical protein [Chthoniobacterales bacterium]